MTFPVLSVCDWKFIFSVVFGQRNARHCFCLHWSLWNESHRTGNPSLSKRRNDNGLSLTVVSRGEGSITRVGHRPGEHGLGCVIGVSVWRHNVRFSRKICTIFHSRFGDFTRFR